MLHELFITHCTNGTLIMNPFTFIKNWFDLFCIVNYQFLVWIYISFLSSILLNCLSCSILVAVFHVSIILPDFTLLYTCQACSFIKYCLSLGLLQFICPPMLVLRGKNTLESFLPFISLNVLILYFLQNLFY